MYLSDQVIVPPDGLAIALEERPLQLQRIISILQCPGIVKLHLREVLSQHPVQLYHEGMHLTEPLPHMLLDEVSSAGDVVLLVGFQVPFYLGELALV